MTGRFYMQRSLEKALFDPERSLESILKEVEP